MRFTVLRLLRDLHLVDDLSVAGIRLRDPQRQIVLLLGVDSPSQNHRVLVDMYTNVAVAECGFQIKTLLNLLLHFWS